MIVLNQLGVAADLSHINTKSNVSGYQPASAKEDPTTDSAIGDALKGAEIVLVPAGVPRKPGMTRDGN